MIICGDEKIKNPWAQFMDRAYMKEGLVRKIIYDSWIRSKDYGIDPFVDKIKISLTDKELHERYECCTQLTKRAKPFMDSLNKIVGSSNLIIRLTDKEGYVLDFLGDGTLVEKYGELNLYKGCNVKEESIGTNAIGLALIIEEAIQVVGEEHYCKIYHNWTSSACPIRDENDNLMGVLSITGVSYEVHPHTLGMLMAAAQAIENELKLEKSNKQLDLANKHFHAIMESISEGLICTDNEGIVMDINLFARRFLKMKEADIIGKNIKSILYKKDYKKIRGSMSGCKKMEEEEIYFKTEKGRTDPCIVDITPIKVLASNEIEGVVITFKQEKIVHKLVNKIVGAQARFTFHDILGQSINIKSAKNMASLAATTDTTTLLLGESGVGKEMFAQAIHNGGERSGKPFVVLNCGAIPRDLVASELFGYVEGAFTGAKRGGHHGKFELADGGTIFLDEIGDMPLDAQVSLLRVLETKQIVRIGGHEVIPIDVRVIAATHKNLEKEVERGNFREDLFYRLNVMPVSIPSLRERKEDVSIFADYFINKFTKNMNKDIKGIDKSFYKALKRYSWPGNVRELQNVIQLVINMISDREYITKNNLPNHILEKTLLPDIELDENLYSLEDMEKMAIIRTLKITKNNLALTAKILGIGRSTLYRKMDKYLIKSVLK
jgi:PAS domain S-box-containing protein